MFFATLFKPIFSGNKNEQEQINYYTKGHHIAKLQVASSLFIVNSLRCITMIRTMEEVLIRRGRRYLGDVVRRDQRINGSNHRLRVDAALSRVY